MIDANVEQSAGWWFKILASQLVDRRLGRAGGRTWNRTSETPSRMRPGLDLLEDYRRGEPPLNSVAAEWKPHVREFMRNGRLHLADLLTSATSNRLQLRDFRTAAADDEVGDLEARRVMRANDMKVLAREVHADMIALGDAYTIVTPPTGAQTISTITAESPLEVITAHDARTGRIIAGLKLYRDEWNSADVAYVHLPGGTIKRAVKKGASSIALSGFRLAKNWEWDADYGINGEATVPGGVMAIARFRNRDGVGEYERHLGTLDRINEKIANEWWLGKLQAHRQAAVRGLPDQDEDGNDIDYDGVFTRDAAAMWRVPKDVDFWESSPADMGPLIVSITKDLERLAAALQLPLSSVTPAEANGSAAMANSMTSEQIFKILDRRERAEGGWVQTMSLAFAFMDDSARADVSQLEPMWGPIDLYSLTDRAQAASQLKGVLPNEAILTDVLQYAPADIPNLRVLRGRDLLFEGPAV